MATKEHRRHARGLIESLESRVHGGPPIQDSEILLAHCFLRENAFPPSSEYFSRLGQVRNRLQTRSPERSRPAEKRNYGGKAGGVWIQVQSVYDHVILSTCYAGEFNLRRGRLKLSHRFNRAGRIDFLEAKLLQSFDPRLNGQLRKLILIKEYQALRKDWLAADGFVLPVLPQELLLVDRDIFHWPRGDLCAGLLNLGHRLASDLFEQLSARGAGILPRSTAPNGPASSSSRDGPEQLPLEALRADPVALPILESAAALECSVECEGSRLLQVRCLRNCLAGQAG